MKNKKRNNFRSYVDSPAIHVYPLEMKMSMGGPAGSMQMDQRFVLSPPVANDLNEAIGNAKQNRSIDINPIALGILRNYLSTEPLSKPYSTTQLITFMNSRGHSLTRDQIDYGRSLLETEV